VAENVISRSAAYRPTDDNAETTCGDTRETITVTAAVLYHIVGNKGTRRFSRYLAELSYNAMGTGAKVQTKFHGKPPRIPDVRFAFTTRIDLRHTPHFKWFPMRAPRIHNPSTRAADKAGRAANASVNNHVGLIRRRPI
jgi:hypothetical protein